MAHVIKSPAAAADLLEIWDYIAPDNLEAADRVLDMIDEHVHRLLQFQELGRRRDDIAPAIRSLPVGNYVVFYRVQGNDIELVRVLHHARDIEGQFH